MADKVKVNIYMPPELLAALKRVAALQDTSYAELVRVACKKYLLENSSTILGQKRALDRVGSE